MLVGKIIKRPQLQECKTEVLFCLVAQEAPALLRHLMDQTVNTSNSAMLECQVRGIPEPQISWFKNHEEIQQEPGESSVYSPTFYSLFLYPSALGSHLQSHWHRYPDVRQEYCPGITGGQQHGCSGLFCLTPKPQPGWSCRHNGSLWWSQWKKYSFQLASKKSHLQQSIFLSIYYRGSLRIRCFGQRITRQEKTELAWCA